MLPEYANKSANARKNGVNIATSLNANGASHQVDHITPPKHGGTSGLNNLAWACFRRNRNKSTDIASIDEITSELTLLYNPRTQSWEEHFELRDGVILGKTAVGRVTVRILNVNHPKQVAIRRALIESGLWG